MSNRVIHKMRVEQIIDHNPLVRELVLAAEGQGISFKAGQFATLHVPHEPKPAMRAYSFASDERDKQNFRLIFKKVDGGIASNFVWQLRGGEVLDFTGPFGRVFFKEPPSRQIIFCCTGSGVSQHYSYLLSKKEQYPDLRYRMLFGVRSEADIFFRSELDALKTVLKDFQYEFVLSEAAPTWAGKRGYLQQILPEYDYKNTETTFYLCGNGEMIKGVKAHLEKDGFDKTRIMAEAFD